MGEVSLVASFSHYSKIQSKYTQWSRTQSSRLPTVFRATHIASEPHPTPQQTKYMPTVASIASCPESYLPSREWERDTLYTFSQLRLVRKPPSNVSRKNVVLLCIVMPLH